MDEEFTCDLLQITKMHKDNYYFALTRPQCLKITLKLSHLISNFRLIQIEL